MKPFMKELAGENCKYLFTVLLWQWCPRSRCCSGLFLEGLIEVLIIRFSPRYALRRKQGHAIPLKTRLPTGRWHPVGWGTFALSEITIKMKQNKYALTRRHWTLSLVADIISVWNFNRWLVTKPFWGIAGDSIEVVKKHPVLDQVISYLDTYFEGSVQDRFIYSWPPLERDFESGVWLIYRPSLAWSNSDVRTNSSRYLRFLPKRLASSGA